MTKVLGLIGSKRPYGNCQVIVETCLEMIKNYGIEIETIYLKDLNLKHCNGCLACVYKGDCTIKDDMGFLLKKIIESEGLVVAAPTYIFSPSSLIKTILDRCMTITPFLDTLEKQKRNSVCISVAGNPKWNPLGLVQLKQLALAYGYRLIDSMEVFATGPGEVILHENILENVKTLGQRLADSLKGNTYSPPLSSKNCPFCKNKVFSINENNEVQCVTCGAEGVLNYDIDKFKIKFSPVDNNFFLLSQRKEHVDKWMMDSRDNFLKNREEIQQKLKQWGIKK